MQAFGLSSMTQGLSVLTGISAGMTEALLVVSFELVKIRMQDKQLASKYSSTTDCIRQIWRQEGGFWAFWKGTEATLWRHAMWNGGYFGVIHWVRSLLPKPKDKREKLLSDFVSGAIGGSVGTLLNTPFDVVKTRIQGYVPAHLMPGYQQTTATATVQSSVAPFRYAWPGIVRIAREEGFSALYKGFLPKVLRLCPGGGVLLVVYDQAIQFLRKFHHQD